MKKLLIVTTGDFSREIYWHAQNSLGYGIDFEIKGFLEGNIPCRDNYPELPMAVLGNIDSYEFKEDDVFIIANADPALKEILANMIIGKGGSFMNLIHKTSLVADSAKLGTDVILGAYTTVSVDVSIGNHVMLNSYTSVGHDATIGDYSSTMGHVSINGHVLVEDHVYFGCGAKALPSSKIGSYAKVGAGSVVLRKVKKGQTVFGVPAMPI